MIPCPECDTEVPEGAKFCPECGYEMSPSAQAANQDSGKATSFAQTGGAAAGVSHLETQDDAGSTRGRREAVVTLEAGTEIAGRYIVEDTIGRGGMGVVYRVKDTLTEQILALKLIRKDRLDGPDAAKRLLDEGMTARNIRHSNVVAVYDVGDWDGAPFITMEYLEGISLGAWHRNKMQQREDVPMSIAARIIAEILDGLKSAHDGGVIHRDLKPENIMLVEEPGEDKAPLKILDFGIASVANLPESGTGTGLGTRGYMAPEQITNPAAALPSADIYALSVVFYQLLMDVLPIGHWQPPSGGRSDVPLGIDTLIQTGLSNRPAARQQSTEAYRADLVTAMNEQGMTPPPDPEPDPEPARPKGNQNLKWIGGGIVGLGALFFAVQTFTNTNNERAQEKERQYERQLDAEKRAREAERAAQEAQLETERARREQAQAEAERAERDAQAERERAARAARRAQPREQAPVSSPPPPPPPPPANLYAGISGTWIFDAGSAVSVNVTPNGAFNYQYSDGIGRGQFQGNYGSFEQSFNSYGVTLRGDLQRTDACHIEYILYALDGSPFSSGVVHANHLPGQPCP